MIDFDKKLLIIKVTLKNTSFFLKPSKSEFVKNFRKFLFQNPDWLITFWSISQKPEFSPIWDLSRNTANNINFHYRTNSVKIDDKIFQYFGCHAQNPALSCTTSYCFLASCQNLEKTNDTIPGKCPDRRKDGRTDRSYFIGPFRLLPGV